MPALQIAPAAVPPAVLLVDDEKVVIDVMARMLKTAGFSIATAASGEEALEHLGRQEFACALVDKNLLGMDGLEVIRHVRKRQPRCACVVMTAYASTGSAVEALRLGVVDYLEKPSPELDVIGERIQGAIRVQRVRDQQSSLLRRLSELEQEVERKESARAHLEIELGLATEVGGPAGASAAVRGERDLQLLRGAEAIAGKLADLQKQLKPGAQATLEALSRDFAAHLALLRDG